MFLNFEEIKCGNFWIGDSTRKVGSRNKNDHKMHMKIQQILITRHIM